MVIKPYLTKPLKKIINDTIIFTKTTFAIPDQSITPLMKKLSIVATQGTLVALHKAPSDLNVYIVATCGARFHLHQQSLHLGGAGLHVL